MVSWQIFPSFILFNILHSPTSPILPYISTTLVSTKWVSGALKGQINLEFPICRMWKISQKFIMNICIERFHRILVHNFYLTNMSKIVNNQNFDIILRLVFINILSDQYSKTFKKRSPLCWRVSGGVFLRLKLLRNFKRNFKYI